MRIDPIRAVSCKYLRTNPGFFIGKTVLFQDPEKVASMSTGLSLITSACLSFSFGSIVYYYLLILSVLFNAAGLRIVL